MARYKLKQREVEAIQWNGDNYDEVKNFAPSDIHKYNGCVFYDTPTDHGVLNRGEYLIKYDPDEPEIDVKSAEAFLDLFEPV